MRSQVLTGIKIYTSVFSLWYVPCAPVADGYQHFRWNCRRTKFTLFKIMKAY